MSAIPPATRSRGNSSRMIPNASGKIAPPMPCTTRPRIITWMFVATAATTEPAAKPARVITIIRSLPNMSPSRPTIGVATDALSR